MSEDRMTAAEIATAITPILQVADVVLETIELKAARECLGLMQDHASTLAAWPFPETMNRAEKRRLQNDTFKALIGFLEARQRQRDAAGRPDPYAAGSEVLRMLGEEP